MKKIIVIITAIILISAICLAKMMQNGDIFKTPFFKTTNSLFNSSDNKVNNSNNTQQDKNNCDTLINNPEKLTVSN